MKIARPDHISDLDTIPRMSAWVTTARFETSEDVAFLSGATLNHLHLVLGHTEVPHALLRDRLALRAAVACIGFSGRPERAEDLRDAVHLLRPGDLPGPAGETYLSWRRAVERPVSIRVLSQAIGGLGTGQIADWLDAGQGAPVARAARVLETVLTDRSRAETSALILADAALAQALGWETLLPLMVIGLKRADLRKRRDDLRMACHRAVTASAMEVVSVVVDLSRRAAHLNTVVPKLRAKGAGKAVEMFLTHDAVAPSALPLPDRAARRLCDRLVDLGAIRELTGRDTFRLYGV